MSEHDWPMEPRFEIRVHWERGQKRFAVHDHQQDDGVVGIFESVKEASIQCALLWLEHVRTLRTGKKIKPALISLPPRGRCKAQ